ncbi:MAG TPA: ABC transporter substrate-binding protein [Thermomonospora sp.]|nr:ABC transporter substrate-binding protein [Thermomonospora sp.]
MQSGETNRRRAPRRGLAFVLSTAVLATASLTACGGGAATTSGDDGVLNVGLTTPPTNLNPAANGSGQQTLYLALANEPLTYLKADGSIGPGLATSWRYVGEGNTKFELTLRTGAKFSDGTAVDAAAVKGWLEYFFFKSGSPFAANIAAKRIETEGTSKVTLHLSEPNPVLPYLLSQVYNIGDVASPAGVAKPASLATQTRGAGPYMIDPAQTVTNDHYTYVPNPHYYDKARIHYKKIVIKVISQPSTMLAAIRSGQIDVAPGDVTTVRQAKSAGLQIISKPSGWDGLIFLDRKGKLAPALGNVKVRQALNYAVDRKTLVKGLLGEYATPTSQPPTLDGHDPALDEHYPYDPARAKALLAEAGYPNGFTLPVTSMGFAQMLGDPVVQAIGKYLAAVGVKLTITSGGTQAQYGTQLFSKKYAATGFVQQPVLPMYMFYVFYLAPKNSLNQHGWNDPGLDKLWSQGAVAADTTETAKAMSRRGVEDAYNLPVASIQSIWYASKNVTGVDFSAGTGFPYPAEWRPAGPRACAD